MHKTLQYADFGSWNNVVLLVGSWISEEHYTSIFRFEIIGIGLHRVVVIQTHGSGGEGDKTEPNSSQ